MKAKSRRRLLISSVAMLLVAMLALGTATFAWFTTSANVQARDINVSTTKSSHLELSKSDLAWSATGITYIGDTALPLKPASSADGTNWYSGVAALATASPIAQTAGSTYSKIDASAISPSGDFVYKEMLNIKNAGTKAVNGVTVTISATNMSPLARLAVVPVADQVTANVFPAAADAATFKANIYAATASKTWDAVTGTGATVAYNATKTAMTSKDSAANGATISVGNMATSGDTNIKSYMVFVWFEGEDENLFNTTESSLLVPDITFTVTGQEAD